MAKKRSWLRKRKVCRLGIKKGVVRVGVDQEMEMEMENLKLYLENKFIMEENKRLRERALVLVRENSALRCHLDYPKKASIKHIVC
ncbi:protein LITTLE ZIPPER 1-like [Dioscorea cayenensis subsp. rotundata]|uniref:Protein LITTLE ZIPPER 1-like n=1 Tax=Dioscorea cayennensis subsp. rotundata TaxID=55577 RepID=A0AB40C7U0_DIOCR|nr:protein LITTLE ZIPPER 1-like [Dioscorea cayenensis subsp. rotundata]